MKYSAVIFVVCAFFAMASARAVAESPDELSDEKRFLWDTIVNAAKALVGLQEKVSDLCKANSGSLPDPLTRACHCVHAFDNLGDEEQQMPKRSINKRFIAKLYNKVKSYVNQFCAGDLMSENNNLDHACQCITGQERG